MKPKEIQDLLDFIAQSGLEEVSIETESVKIATKKSPASVIASAAPVLAPVAMPAPVQAVAPKAEAPKAEVAAPSAAEANYKTIKSPMIGTFYRSSGPNEEAFVNVGDAINEGTTVCIIEAMKLFNEIESEFSGKIVKILVQDATPVEYDQPLFLVDPA